MDTTTAAHPAAGGLRDFKAWNGFVCAPPACTSRVLWQVTSANKAIDPAGPWGDEHVAWSWAFILERLMGRRRGCWSGCGSATSRRPSGRPTCCYWWNLPTT